jgi:phosphate ABC transporter, permease protein PstC
MALEQKSNSILKQNLVANVDGPKFLFRACALITALVIIFIVLYVFYEALPAFMDNGINFLISGEWDHATHKYGIYIFVVNTVIVTALTMLITVPLGLMTAIFLAEFSPKWLAKTLRPLIELLLGIPSVVYGIFGLFVLGNIFETIVDPFIDSTLGFIPIFEDVAPTGSSILLASLVLAVMVIPTMTVLSEEAIRAVPRELREGSLALGTTRWETVKKLLLPVAFRGISTAFILSMMRAMGETMAIVMLTGSVMKVPTSILDMGMVMTTKIVTEIGYYISDDQARAALFGIAAALFVMEFILLVAIKAISRRGNYG